MGYYFPGYIRYDTLKFSSQNIENMFIYSDVQIILPDFNSRLSKKDVHTLNELSVLVSWSTITKSNDIQSPNWHQIDTIDSQVVHGKTRQCIVRHGRHGSA